MTIAIVTTRTWQRRSRKDVLPRSNGRQRARPGERQRMNFVLQRRHLRTHDRRPARVQDAIPSQG